MTVAGTSALLASRNSKVLALMVAGSIASLKVAVTPVSVATPVAPATGRRAHVTVGGVVSGPVLVANTTSTQ